MDSSQTEPLQKILSQKNNLWNDFLDDRHRDAKVLLINLVIKNPDNFIQAIKKLKKDEIFNFLRRILIELDNEYVANNLNTIFEDTELFGKIIDIFRKLITSDVFNSYVAAYLQEFNPHIHRMTKMTGLVKFGEKEKKLRNQQSLLIESIIEEFDPHIQKHIYKNTYIKDSVKN